MPPPSLRIGLVDMNNGFANQAMRCFRRILDVFELRVREKNPGLVFHREEVQPRNLGELPQGPYDLVISTGGPGSPFDGIDDPWGVGYRRFLDEVFTRNQRDAAAAPKLLVICHSFELAVLHFGVAQVTKRDTPRFGLMPAYPTRIGREVDFFKPFGDRLFAWEHRWWQAIEPDRARLDEIGGSILAQESREEGPLDKGEALLALTFGKGIDGTQFHPEADKSGVLAWIQKQEHADQLKDRYGDSLYERMLKSLNDETRLARTHAVFIPGWLTCRFNDIARERALSPLEKPETEPNKS